MGQLIGFVEHRHRHVAQAKCQFEDKNAVTALELLLEKWKQAGACGWDDMTCYAFEVVKRHLWLHQILEGTSLHPDKPFTAVMSTLPQDKNHLKIWLHALWQSIVASDLGVEWHIAIDPFCLELRKDAKFFKFESEDFVHHWKRLTNHYNLLQMHEEIAEDVRHVQLKKKNAEEVLIDKQLQKLEDSWFKQSFFSK